MRMQATCPHPLPLKQFNRTCLSGREDGKLLVFFKGSRAWLISLNSAPPRAEDEDRVFRRMMICFCDCAIRSVHCLNRI